MKALPQFTQWAIADKTIHPTAEVKMNVKIDPEGVVVIGAETVVSEEVRFQCHTHQFHKKDWQRLPRKQHIKHVGRNVFIGECAIITFGCQHIADGVVIGTGSVVTHDITQPYTIWAGNPARQIGVVEE